MLDEVIDVVGQRQLEVADGFLAVALGQLELAEVEVGFAQALGELPVVLHPFHHVAHQLGGVDLAGIEADQIPVPGVVVVLVEAFAHPAHGRRPVELLLGQIEPDHPVGIFRLRLVETLHVGGGKLGPVAVIERYATVEVGVIVIRGELESRIECLIGLVIVLLLNQIDTDEVVSLGKVGLLPQGAVEVEPSEGTKANPVKHHGTLIEQLGTLFGRQFHFTEHLPESRQGQLALVGDLQGGRQYQ
ncbi:hypothetical protein D3C75_613810 [compost metagenome]